ncbi:MAG: ion channel [Spirochaetes bacterium]|jgi:voltage-gated potassium channel|nr:ion channel [Spirochaetota bacterium]
MIPNITEKIIESRFIKSTLQIIKDLRKNFIIKLFTVAILILICFSIAIFYTEKGYVRPLYENGQKIDEKTANIKTFEDSIWWAMVTSTTVGYGDYFPVSRAGRIIGIIIMFFGVALMGAVTGNIASLLVEKQLKEGRGLEKLKLKNHFIICGWKRDMASFLHDIMSKNRNYLSSEMVLINTAEPEEIENLKSDSELKHINYIQGDYVDERVLQRANIKNAARVLVLADVLVQGSSQEVDSRTVMTIITIKSISKYIYTCAELISSKFKNYLMTSNCDEIILSSEYNRLMIANASSGSGISHVISELLDIKTDVAINTIDIPKNYIGRQYNELSKYVHDKDRSLLIGILENTGNFNIRKRDALREAQKTADISRLVDNLKTVKTLVANLPVINPEPEYIIKNYSKAIIIEGSHKTAKSEKGTSNAKV